MSAGAAPSRRPQAGRHGQDALELALTRAFWGAVQQQPPMPVMAALEAAARALGALYRDAAASHGPGGCCGCGWQPDAETDLLVLEAMLAAAAGEAPRRDLATMAVAGRA